MVNHAVNKTTEKLAQHTEKEESPQEQYFLHHIILYMELRCKNI